MLQYLQDQWEFGEHAQRYRYGSDDKRPHFTCLHPENSRECIQQDAQNLDGEIVGLIVQAAASKHHSFSSGPNGLWARKCFAYVDASLSLHLNRS